jgi:hypothetical protein
MEYGYIWMEFKTSELGGPSETDIVDMLSQKHLLSES